MTRYSNPVPLEPPAAERRALARLDDAGLRRAHEVALQKMAAARTPPEASAASYEDCYVLWEAQRRGVALDRSRIPNPASSARMTAMTSTWTEPTRGDRLLVRQAVALLRPDLPEHCSEVDVCHIRKLLEKQMRVDLDATEEGRRALTYAIGLLYGEPTPGELQLRRPAGCACEWGEFCNVAHDPELCDCDQCVVACIRAKASLGALRAVGVLPSRTGAKRDQNPKPSGVSVQPWKY